MPTERDELTEIIREEINRELETARKAAGETVDTTKEPISLNIGGQTYNFDTKADMEAAIGKTFQTFRNELEKAKTPIEEGKGGYVSGKESDGADKFSQDKYIELMGKDALEAQRYVQDHIYGIPDSSNFIKGQLQEAATLKATVSAYQFRELHPEFPMTPEATKIVDGIRRELNLPFTLQGLEASYGVAQTRGVVPSPQLLAYQKDLISKGILPDPNNQQQEQTQQQNFTRPNPSGLGFQPPPSIGRTTSVPGADMAQVAENMSLEQLEAALRRAGQL